MASTSFAAGALVLQVVFLTATPSAADAAEFWFEPIPENNDVAVVTLYGPIAAGDVDRLVLALRESIKRGYYIDIINLFSPGGDAAEGIRLGRIINRYFLVTQAPHVQGDQFVCPGYPGSAQRPFQSQADANCICASACAIAWLGGIGRHGMPGFHRVYSDFAKLTYGDAREMRRWFDQEIEGYLAEVGAPGFVEDLIETSGPEELSWPEAAQLAQLQDNIDYSNTTYAACQAFHMPLTNRQYLSTLREKAQTGMLSAQEQRQLSDLEVEFQRASVCHEQVRRRELANAQAELR